MAAIPSAELDQTYRQIEALVMLAKCVPLRRPLPPMRGWAASPDFALLLYQLVQDEAPGLVVECGSGVSSLVLGYALEAAGAGRLITFEHDRRHFDITGSWVRRHGLERWVEVVHAPLAEMRSDGEVWQWYGSEVERSLAGQSAHLLVVDGPPGQLQPLSRYPALPRLSPFLAERVTVVLDDADRTDEKAIIARWLRQQPRFSLQHLTHEKGTALLSRRG
jgi:hypothetical protein